MTCATGIGSLPGTEITEALREVRDTFVEPDLPYLPELPARGPGADLVGRTAGLLVQLPVDLQPSGWRFVDRPGRDARRTASFWRRDLDELAEAFDGYTGDLKLQVAGPWTLASTIQLNRGERAVMDQGAAKEIVDSLAEGVGAHLREVGQLVPGASLVLQLDEPALPAVLAGSLPTASGFGRVRAVNPQTARDGIQTVLSAAGDRATVVHCCHPDVPLRLLAEAGAGSVAVDTSLLTLAGWDAVAEGVESGTGLYAGCLPTDGTGAARAAAASLSAAWDRLGLERRRLDDVVVTPACGLAGLTPQGASSVQQMVRDVARELTDTAGDDR